MARASILWLMGEYCERVPKIAPDVLRKMAKTFTAEEDIVKLQIVNLAAKLYLTNSKQVVNIIPRHFCCVYLNIRQMWCWIEAIALYYMLNKSYCKSGSSYFSTRPCFKVFLFPKTKLCLDAIELFCNLELNAQLKYGDVNETALM